jgi:hypothetical protein
LGIFFKKITEHFKLEKERWERMKDFTSIDTDLHLHPKMFDESEIIVEDNIDLEIPFK